MRPVELEIILPIGTKTTQIIHVERRSEPKDILETARQLKETCHWKKVRVGLGQDWSNWL